MKEDRPLPMRMWRRLADPAIPPRSWWNPITPYRRLSRDVLVDAYKQYAETTNRTMLALLAVGTFCLLTVISTSDRALLAPEGTIKVPFAEASISFLGFVVVAPLLLVVVCAYLHVFYGYWLDAEHERQEYNSVLPEVQKTPVEAIAMLFALSDPVSRVLTSFVFYWLTPVVLAAIAWKGAGVARLALPLWLLFWAVASALVFLQIRRSDRQRRIVRVLGWLLLAILAGGLAWSAPHAERLQRPLSLFRVDLTGSYLVRQDLRGADLRSAKLSGAELSGANLAQANLTGADCSKINLTGANLTGATLARANLTRATLTRANLTRANLAWATLEGIPVRDAPRFDADLYGVDLTGADLSRANLSGADLTGAVLTEAILVKANLTGANLLRTILKDTVLVRANLTGATLAQATLTGAYFAEARFEKTDLREADLGEARNVTKDQISSATIGTQTCLPRYLSSALCHHGE